MFLAEGKMVYVVGESSRRV